MTKGIRKRQIWFKIFSENKRHLKNDSHDSMTRMYHDMPVAMTEITNTSHLATVKGEETILVLLTKVKNKLIDSVLTDTVRSK